MAERSNRLIPRLARNLPHLLGLVLLAGAVFVVQRQFRHLSFAEIRHGLTAIPDIALAIAAGFTLLSYLILSFYDRMAVRHVGRRLSFRRTFFAAFCSYVLSHNLGFSALSGAAVRFRLYGNWGLKPAEIGQIIAFCSLAFTLGGSALVGAVLAADPHAVPLLGRDVPAEILRALGVLALCVVCAYVALSVRVRRLSLWRLQIDMPRPLLAVGQVVVATLDVAATAAIGYALLLPSPPLGYPTFLAIYIASYTAGLLASVPGGLGVFDGAMLLGLAAWMPPSRILGMVFVFRIFYYIIPLFVAGILFAGHELLMRSDALLARLRGAGAAVAVRPNGMLRQSEADFSVAVSVGAVSLCGTMLLALGVLDPDSDLEALLPPGGGLFDTPGGITGWIAGMAGNYIPSLIGAALIGLAVGLSNRVTLAWGATIVLLCSAAILTALRGTVLLVPGALVLCALLLAPFRSSYYRHARLLSEPLAPGTALPILLLVGCVLILGRLEPNLRLIDSNSWWWVVLTEGATNRTRAALGCAVLLMLVALWRLISPGRIATLPWRGEGRSRYVALLDPPGQLAADLPLPPQGVMLNETGRAAVAFTRLAAPHGGLLVALGDPAGMVAGDQVSAIWRLRDLASQEGRSPVFWSVGETLVPIYEDLGLTCWPLPGPEGEARRFLCGPAELPPPAIERLVPAAQRAAA